MLTKQELATWCCEWYDANMLNIHDFYVPDMLSDFQKRFDWQLITENNLPKLGDEVLREGVWVTSVNEENLALIGEDTEGWIRNSYTHFRPINPPVSEACDGTTR